MVLAALFNDDNEMKFKNKKKKKGHSPNMTIPILDQLQELALKGHSILVKNKVYTFRAIVLTLPLDTFEIPYMVGTIGHGSPCHCPRCMFVGSVAQGLKKKKYHYNRFSSNCNPNVNILDSLAYKLESEKKGKSRKVQKPSILIEMLPSFFATQIIVVDNLHTTGYGIFGDWI